jgi:FemAB-related protein (PEP-CTERM system-associated)
MKMADRCREERFHSCTKAMRIRLINADRDAWDNFVGVQDLGPYLTTAWKETVENGYSHQCFYLAAFSDTSVQGILPLVLISTPLCGRQLVSLPFCDYGGIVSSDVASSAALVEHAINLASQLNASLEIRSAKALATLDADKRFRQITNKCRMVLQLPASGDLLWKGFRSKLRSQIKKAMKNELTHRLGGRELLDDFYRVFCRNMRDLGSPVHSRSWFECVLSAYGDGAVLSVVYHDQIPAAAGMVLKHCQTATIPWASSLQQFNRLNPNMLLYWSLLEHAADAGFREFDFGRSTPDEGTYAFKKQWGAQPMPLYWYRRSGKRDSDAVGSGEGRLRGVVERLWRTMPIGLANAVGPRIRRHISR